MSSSFRGSPGGLDLYKGEKILFQEDVEQCSTDSSYRLELGPCQLGCMEACEVELAAITYGE